MRTTTAPRNTHTTTDAHTQDTAVHTTNDAPKTREPGTSNLARTMAGHRHAYKTVATPTGKTTQNNGDAVATALLAFSLPALAAFGLEHFGKSYDTLNPGHQRMCFGNLLRAAAKKNDEKVLAFLGLLA